MHAQNIRNASFAHSEQQPFILCTPEMSATRRVQARYISTSSCAHSNCQRRVPCTNSLSATLVMHTRNVRNSCWTHSNCQQLALCTLTRSAICTLRTSHIQQLVVKYYIHPRTNHFVFDGLGSPFKICELWSQKGPGAANLAGPNRPSRSEECKLDEMQSRFHIDKNHQYSERIRDPKCKGLGSSFLIFMTQSQVVAQLKSYCQTVSQELCPSGDMSCYIAADGRRPCDGARRCQAGSMGKGAVLFDMGVELKKTRAAPEMPQGWGGTIRRRSAWARRNSPIASTNCNWGLGLEVLVFGDSAWCLM